MAAEKDSKLVKASIPHLAGLHDQTPLDQLTLAQLATLNQLIGGINMEKQNFDHHKRHGGMFADDPPAGRKKDTYRVGISFGLPDYIELQIPAKDATRFYVNGEVGGVCIVPMLMAKKLGVAPVQQKDFNIPELELRDPARLTHCYFTQELAASCTTLLEADLHPQRQIDEAVHALIAIGMNFNSEKFRTYQSSPPSPSDGTRFRQFCLEAIALLGEQIRTDPEYFPLNPAHTNLACKSALRHEAAVFARSSDVNQKLEAKNAGVEILQRIVTLTNKRADFLEQNIDKVAAMKGAEHLAVREVQDAMREEIKQRRALAARVETFKDNIHELFPAPYMDGGKGPRTLGM